jgi:hypothetical protein
MYCEKCRKTGLTKAEVEKDPNSKQILCLGCYSLANPGWHPTTETSMVPAPEVPPPVPGFGYAVCLDSMRGFSAQVSYGQTTLELVIPQTTLKSFLGER